MKCLTFLFQVMFKTKYISNIDIYKKYQRNLLIKLRNYIPLPKISKEIKVLLSFNKNFFIKYNIYYIITLYFLLTTD